MSKTGPTPNSVRAESTGLDALVPPELGVLIALDRPAALRRFTELADWELTVTIARRHRLLGQLAAAVDEAGLGDRIPEDQRIQLRAEWHRRGRWFERRVLPQLVEVCRHLSVIGVTPVLLKGAALVCSGTLEASARPMGDLDLLVRPDEVDAASTVLRTLGYGHRVPADQQLWARRHHYQDPAWYHPDHPLGVEVHWDLLLRSDRRAFDIRTLRCVELALPGAQFVRRLDDPGQLTHLALHFWRDRRVGSGPPLGQLWDVHRVAAALGPTDWSTLRQAARARGHLEVLAAVLACDVILLGSRPPPGFPEVDAMVADRRVRSFALRRVLAPRPPALQMLMVTADVGYTPYRILTRLLAQATRPRHRLVDAYGPGPFWQLRLRHLRTLAGLVAILARSPGASFDGARLDRWAHRL